jgi:hypothetical protein
MPETPDRAVTLDPITIKYFSLGGPNAVLNGGATLGNPTTGVLTAPDGVGRYQQYERGSIYWSGRPDAQAHLIYGQIFARWGQLTWEQGRLGYPTSDEEDGPNGPPQRMNTFEGGSIVWDPQSGAHEKVPDAVPVFAEIIQALKSGYSLGFDLGFAVTEDTPVRGALRHFQLFKENLSRIYNSMEMHLDGTVYLSYTLIKHPLWYDVYNAVDDASLPPIQTASGPQRLVDARHKTVDASTWDLPYRAFNGTGPSPRWFRLDPPDYRVPRPTPSLNDSGQYSDHERWIPARPGGPPEWENILAENEGGNDNGQRLVLPDEPANAPGNHYISWDELYEIMQTDSIRGLNILLYRGHPNGGDHSDRPIPWTPSTVEGVVTNSFLSGEDYGGSHLCPANGYWVGDPPPLYLTARCEYPNQGDIGQTKFSALCDWDIHVKPDRDYHFVLASKGLFTSEIDGNFNPGLQGCLECEIEQWMTPTGYRPQIADRIYMTGRWVIDVGETDWHAEFHPYELIVASHTQPSKEKNAIGGIETIVAVSISGAWAGGILEFDVWPSPRPQGAAKLASSIHTDQSMGLTLEEAAAPEQPAVNHLHFVATSIDPRATLYSGGHNDVTYTINRRLAATVRLWWEPSLTPPPPPPA